MNPQYILVIAVVIIMGWFAFGVIYNLRVALYEDPDGINFTLAEPLEADLSTHRS